MSQQRICHYYVDESGDLVLFDKRGRIIVGRNGCSQHFILGLLQAQDPDALTHDLEKLRAALLADPYFKDVPSMQPEQRKTALAFHAKDDCAEVRREVFHLLLRQDLSFSAVVRNKAAVVAYVQERNRHDPAYRYRDHELYDYTVRRLFKTHLHKADQYRVCFARRGSRDRTSALRAALETAQQRAIEQWHLDRDPPIHVRSASLPGSGGLQAVDYFLWALQRLYARGEDRYITMLWPKCSLVIDVDDTRQNRYGVYYTKKKPLSLAAIRQRPEI